MVEEKGSQPRALGVISHQNFPVPPTQLCPAGEHEPETIQAKLLQFHCQAAAPGMGEFWE